MNNAYRLYHGIRLSDAQAEALSIVAARERGECGPKSWGSIRERTSAILRSRNLLHVPPGGGLALTDLGHAVVADLPEWDWRK